jgi:hypothetical protein
MTDIFLLIPGVVLVSADAIIQASKPLKKHR